MKKIFILSSFLFAGRWAVSQSVRPDAVLSGGSRLTVNTGGTTVIWDCAIGEPIIGDASNAQLSFSQGFLHYFVTSAASPLPVLGLEFYVTRLNKQQVQLHWKTVQEVNNKGFHLERKKENEVNFSGFKFVSSKVQGGNSSFPLTYQQMDTNNFAGKTYYRLKQEDADGKFIYSVVRLINGEAEKAVTLKAWPIPAPKDFSVMMIGIPKDVLMVYDATGKLVKQFAASENEMVKIAGLAAGIYFIKLKSQADTVQKITVQ